MFKRKKFLLGIIIIIFFIFIQYSCFAESSIKIKNDLTVRTNYQIEEVAYIENTGGDTFKTIVENDLLIVMDMDGGLKFYNIENPSNPNYLGGYDDSGLGHDMQKIGDKLYVANHQLGLQIFDISDLTNPIKLGSLIDSQSGETDSVYVRDNLAFVAVWYDTLSDFKIKIINVTNPALPIEIAEYDDADNGFFHIFVDQGICYTSSWSNGFKILNVTNLQSINQIAHFNDNLDGTAEFQIVNDIVYLADKTGLNIINIDVLDSPSRLGVFDSNNNYVFGIKVVEDIAFIAINGIGLKVLNVSNPTNIIELTEYSGTTMVDVEIHDDLIFLSMHQNGLMILRFGSDDISSGLPLQAIHIISIIPIFVLINKIKGRIKGKFDSKVD